MLQLRNIRKVYKNGTHEIVALDNVSIDFPDKGLVFVLGKSGSGKSTLLNILGGLDKMDAGEIIIDGNSTSMFTSSDFDAFRNYHVGFIFQEFNLLEDETVYENIALALKIQSKGHDATTIDEALKLVNLEGLGYRTPNELSGGQKQRIAIARALVKNPNIILADEPTGALDSKTGYDLMSALKSLAKDKLVIVVSHDEDMAHHFADKIIQISDGHILNTLVISDNYVPNMVEDIDEKVIKVNSGENLKSCDDINKSLSSDSDNCVCIITNPELITIAHPELYDKIFKSENTKDKYAIDETPLLDINKSSKKRSRQKANLKMIECFKMAFSSFKKAKGKIVFLLLFTILSISMLGLSYSISTVTNEKIISNTLLNNDISLGIMEKQSGSAKALLNSDSLKALDETYPNSNYALGQEIELDYLPAIDPGSSEFAMGHFSGIVETNNISDLNLKIVAGEGKFDENSLENNEVIISDYAAYELRRTGFIGFNTSGVSEIVKPEDEQSMIGCSFNIGLDSYKIKGIFDTNYEDFLSILVSESYVADSDNQKATLSALKNYYYARLFAPVGFYGHLYENNPTASNFGAYTLFSTTVETYDAVNETYSLSRQRFTYSNFKNFATDYSGYERIVWGHVPEKLSGNQVILNYTWLQDFQVTSTQGIQHLIDTLGNIEIDKLTPDYQSVESIIWNEPLEVVAVLEYDYSGEIIPSAIDRIYFSSEFAEQMNSTMYSFNQVLFTLNGGSFGYERTINSMIKDGYTVINFDGSTAFASGDLDTFKTVAMIVSLILIVFAFCIIVNFVSGNVRARKKEIGILRATGARKIDVIKIFAVEEGIISLVVSIVSIIIVSNLCNLINGIYGNVDIGIELIVFNYLPALIILLGTFLFIGIATLIPVISIANLKPIDAIRKV